MFLNAITERLKRRSEDDFKGRHLEALLMKPAASSGLSMDC